MDNKKDFETRRQSQITDSKSGQYSHQGSSDDVGKALDVNENDVRDQKRSTNVTDKSEHGVEKGKQD